jgi:hypothetical protein
MDVFKRFHSDQLASIEKKVVDKEAQLNAAVQNILRRCVGRMFIVM